MVRPLLRVASLLAFAALLPAQQAVPSPVDFLGKEVGADHYLCNWTDMLRYFRAVDAASDRLELHEIGPSGYGQTMHMAVITSPQNHARLQELRQISTRLARARDAEPAVARELAESGRAVVWIDAGLHATEVIAGQNIIELVWQMCSRDDQEVRRILDEVVLLACPVNPDGLEMVANAYAATGSTSTPVLYQRYCGHDNNRDFYAVNTRESENVSRVHYIDWCPQIVYNHHQTAPAGTIIFTPPFRDPHNYNVDPMVVRGIGTVAAHMHQRFAFEGKPGVISRNGAPYSGWWNGGLRTTNYFHNIIGILTESFGRPEPTRIRPSLERRLPDGDHPDAVPEQVWHARQTIEYLQTANFAILDYASRYRRELLQGIWRMGRNSIERGSRDHWTVTPKLVAAAKLREDPESVFRDPLLRDPRAYLLRPDRGDFGAAVRLIQALQKSGIEVHRATAAFRHGGVAYPAGTLLVRCDQAFRPHVIDQFEPQWHPDDFRDGKPVPPYDAAGWTMALQCDVHVDRTFEPVDGPFAELPLGELVARAPVEVPASATGWTLDPRDSDTVPTVNRLLGAGVAVSQATSAPFAFHVPASARDALATAAAQTGVRPVAGAAPAGARSLRQPRVGLFDVYGGHMPTGWDLWVLERYGFPVRQVWGARIARGDLKAEFDVLVFHTGLPGGRDLSRMGRGGGRDEDSRDKLAAALPAFEDWSNLAERAERLTGENSLDHLKAFVEQGGTLVALEGECDKVIRHWDLPIKVGTHVPGDNGGEERRTRREEFYVPGSLLGIEVDTAHPLAAGMRADCAVMFNNDCVVMEVTAPRPGIEVVARYRNIDTLASGWAVGEEFLAGKAAVVSVQVGKGRLVLCGADTTYRAQPVNTFRFLFHAALGAGAR